MTMKIKIKIYLKILYQNQGIVLYDKFNFVVWFFWILVNIEMWWDVEYIFLFMGGKKKK